MSFGEKLFFSDLRKMSFSGEFQKNRYIFLHEIFRDGSLSLYEDSMPLTKMVDLYICRKLFGHAWTCPNSEIYLSIFKSEGMYSVGAYCLDNMLFYELSEFQVISIYTF